MDSIVRIGRTVARLKLTILLASIALLLFGYTESNTQKGVSSQQAFPTNTWSIVAVDPVSGDLGVAAASCVPDAHMDALAALVPGRGVAAIQAWWVLDNRNQVFDMLQAGDSAQVIIDKMSDPRYDAERYQRQYGIVTIHGGELDVAAYTGATLPAWAGDRQLAVRGVTVQGNILVGPEVVSDAMSAFARNEPGFDTLPDRLMRALEAGSAAGGDARCNNEEVTQTAAAAVILVARGGDEAYAAEDMGLTDAGTQAAPWLALSVFESQFGPNPIVELRRQYDEWRLENLEGLGDKSEQQVENQSEQQSGDQAEQKIEDQAEEQTEAQVDRQTETQIEKQTEDQVEQQSEDHVEQQSEDQARIPWYLVVLGVVVLVLAVSGLIWISRMRTGRNS